MRAARTDSNHQAIVQALRQVGASVQSLAQIGNGCPDLLVSYRRRYFLLEVKTKTGKLRKKQDDWIAEWQAEVGVVRSVEDALKAIGASR